MVDVLEHLHISAGQRNTLLAAQKREQYRNAFAPSHAGIDSKLPHERPADDAHGVTGLGTLLWQHDQPADLTLANFIERAVGHMGRVLTVHDQANDAEAPPR